MSKGLENMAAQIRDEAGRCWSCDYLLRGVESGRCPECGRGFDRTDPASINYGRAIGRAGRWMIGRLRLTTILIAFAGAALVLWTTPWPVKGWHFSLLDLRFYGAFWQWRERRPGMSGIDAAYTIGLFLTAAVLMGWLVRAALRTFARICYRPPRQLRERFWGRSVLLLIMLGVTFAGIGVGWPYRIGQRWAHEWEVASPTSHVMVYAPPLFQMTGADLPLRAVILKGRTARERRFGLKILTEAILNVEIDRAQHIRESLDQDTALENRVLAMHLAALMAQGELEPNLIQRLDDRSVEIRIAAADSLAILWNSATVGARDISGGYLDGDPTIELTSGWGKPDVTRPEVARRRLESMMFSAVTLEEREAAAKAMVYAPEAGATKLRYAEWGVLIGEGPNKVRFTNALTDDVPPFVHHIGNSVSEFESRIVTRQPAGFGKPVIHLTVDRPMAIELELGMNNGRPWVAYPLFDDLVLLKGQFGDSLEDGALGPLPSIRIADPKGMAPLSNLREGYAWWPPNRREYARYDYSALGGRPLDSDKLSDFGGIGMLWQSLIVTPQPLAGSRLAEIPPDGKYDWWKRLRQTPCSWVNSRGESERFLYYDGPTLMPAPVNMKLKEGELSWTVCGDSRPEEPRRKRNIFNPDEPDRPDGIEDSRERSAVFIEVHKGKIRGFWINEDALTSENSETIADRIGPLASSDFTAKLIKHGLKEPEAQALIACWQKTFFETDGRRALVIMSQADYEALCPMTVRPWPTELARVGVVWTEFK